MTATGLSSRVQVRELTGGQLGTWDSLVRRFANHRVVHTMAWLKSLEASGFGQALFLSFEKDGESVGCIPGLLSEVGPLRVFGSPPPGSQTVSMGPVFDEHRVSTPELMDALTSFLERRLGVHHMEIMSPNLDPATMPGLGFRGEPGHTYLIRLFPADEAQTLKQLKDSARRNIIRGVKQGLDVHFETDESFVNEHYRQIKEVYLRSGKVVSFKRQRVLECFRQLRESGNLVAVSVYLPSRVNIATGMFTIEGTELLLWTWGQRTRYRWHRPTELMTWTVMQRAVREGCETFDLTGIGELRTKFGAELDSRRYRWIRSRYRWMLRVRDFAAKSFHWQQMVRGQVARLSLPAAFQGLEPVPSIRNGLRK
jgi:Acetyltransferase (GNAT) domain